MTENIVICLIICVSAVICCGIIARVVRICYMEGDSRSPTVRMNPIPPPSPQKKPSERPIKELMDEAGGE